MLRNYKKHTPPTIQCKASKADKEAALPTFLDTLTLSQSEGVLCVEMEFYAGISLESRCKGEGQIGFASPIFFVITPLLLEFVAIDLGFIVK